MEDDNGNEPLGLWNVVPTSIGAMVETGIFALLGQVASLMEASTWVVFAFGGIVAMSSSCTYARLEASYPSNGGITDFSRHGLGSGVFLLTPSLLYLLALAVSIAIVVHALGTYAVQFLHEGSLEEHLILLYTLGIIAVMILFNSLSNHAVERLEVILVGIKMITLSLLTIAGVWSLRPAYISVSTPPSSGAFFSCIGITFPVYADFGMTADAADRVKSPEVIMPRAFLAVISATTLFCVSLALALLSNVSTLGLEKYADTAAAQATPPLLGHAGYMVIVTGALLVTVSAINTNLFIVLNIMGNIGSGRELSKLMNKPLRRQSTWGNIIVVVSIMLTTAAPDLGSLVSVTSATFLICYLAVFTVAIRLCHDIHASLPILIIGTLVMLLAIVSFIYSLWSQGNRALIWTTGVLLLSLIVTMVMKYGETVWHPSARSTSCIIVVTVDIRTSKKTCLDIY